MLNLTVIYFFCVDKTQFESLNTDIVKKISMTNESLVKSAEQDTVRLVVNDKN